MVGIAIISFVIGSMFNVMASDGGGNPWDKVWTEISELESKVETLEGQLPQQGFLTAPAYDSGWLPVTPEWITLEHGLNTTEVFVYVIQNYTEHGINQFRYGEGLTWVRLTYNEVIVIADGWTEPTEVRVMIWKISEP